jgi:predicted transcriptional regulator
VVVVGGPDDMNLPGGTLEYGVLVALWTGGTLSAREVHERTGGPLGLVYTTTTKVLERLHVKGLVERRRRDGIFVYKTKVDRTEIDRARFSRSLTDLFGDKQRPAVAALVEAMESLDPSLVDELEAAVAARRRPRG